jgi:hypothetical protein
MIMLNEEAQLREWSVKGNLHKRRDDGYYRYVSYDRYTDARVIW